METYTYFSGKPLVAIRTDIGTDLKYTNYFLPFNMSDTTAFINMEKHREPKLNKGLRK